MAPGVHFDRSTSTPPPPSRTVAPWLEVYPIFRDELAQNRTTFSALPACAKLTALQQGPTGQSTIAGALDNVSVSLIELDTCSVEATMLRYWPAQTRRYAVPAIAASSTRPKRSPCLLRPGYGLFDDSWTQFAAYCERGDATIPLLAVDWLDFHLRLRAANQA
jgi:hypothetical protein